MVGFYSGDPIDSASEEAQGTDLIPSTLDQQMGAAFSSGIADTPIARIARYAGSQIGGDQAPDLTPEEANQQYGIPGTLSFKDPVSPDVASSLHDAKHDQLVRDDTLARGEGGFLSGAAQFGARVLPQFFDPLNLASAFVPGLGEARAAAVLGRVGIESTLAARAVAGATQGIAGQAALEPLNYGLDQAEHNDWTMGQALSNIAFGGLLGGGLHLLTGLRGGAEASDAAIDAAMPKDAPATAEQMANPMSAAMEAAGPGARDGARREGLSAILEDRPNNVSEGLEAMRPPAPPDAAPDPTTPPDLINTAADLTDQGASLASPQAPALEALRADAAHADTPDIMSARAAAAATQDRAPQVANPDLASQLGEAQAHMDRIKAMIDASPDEEAKSAMADLSADDQLHEGNARALEAAAACMASRVA